MVAFDRDSGVCAESAMKYFVLGAIASGALLYGMSLIYGLTGTLDLAEIAARLRAPNTAGVILGLTFIDRKSTRLNSRHRCTSYALFCLKKKRSHATHTSHRRA